MKKIYPLPAISRLPSPEAKASKSAKAGLLLMFISTLAFSQQKSAFGFVVKAGNYALPHKNTIVKSYSTFSEKHNAGSTYTLGLWQSIPLGKRFEISAELLYRNITIIKEESRGYAGSSGNPGIMAPVASLHSQRINQSSISIPLKLHYLLDKKGKTSLAFGGGISRNFAENVVHHQEFREKEAAFVFTPSDFQESVSDWDAFSNNFHVAAGLFHRIDPKTSVGIEYTFERSSQLNTYFYYSSLSRYCDCKDYDDMPKMNSFSVSLRHNILGDRIKN